MFLNSFQASCTTCGRTVQVHSYLYSSVQYAVYGTQFVRSWEIFECGSHFRSQNHRKHVSGNETWAKSDLAIFMIRVPVRRKNISIIKSRWSHKNMFSLKGVVFVWRESFETSSGRCARDDASWAAHGKSIDGNEKNRSFRNDLITLQQEQKTATTYDDWQWNFQLQHCCC